MSSKQFCLKWTKFQTSILNAFESLQNTEDLADVTLTCEGISLKAHKFILSACSPYFRTIFKENPCSHPIVILKDVTYLDLIAIVNFMYHGEVMVAEEQLPSFLQTALLLQVSGLINTDTPHSIHRAPPPLSLKKNKCLQQPNESIESPSKKTKLTAATALPVKAMLSTDENNKTKKVSSDMPLANDEIKTEKTEQEEPTITEAIFEHESPSDILKSETQQGSILEAALETAAKSTGSILERSLTSQPTCTKLPSTIEKYNVLQVLPDISIPKSVFIPRKPPENELERLILRSSSESSSSSPSTFEQRPNDYLHQSIKIEGNDHQEMEIISAEDAALNYSKAIVDPPHHSSQCGTCPHCKQAYSNQSALKYHVRLVHSDLTNTYSCHLCPEVFDYREGFKKHMMEVHSVRN